MIPVTFHFLRHQYSNSTIAHTEPAPSHLCGSSLPFVFGTSRICVANTSVQRMVCGIALSQKGQSGAGVVCQTPQSDRGAIVQSSVDSARVPSHFRGQGLPDLFLNESEKFCPFHLST
mmetsp:Transcript_38652/g.44516  ORF Transcript_38652/g.44516 Transcript_38652/m.44516 type:complete len:118 (+) Transcript_38652:139-492(+)